MRHLQMAGALTVVVLSAFPLVANAAVHTGDSLEIKVYNHPELSRTAKVDSNGDISLPLAKKIHVAGLNEDDVSTRVVAALRPYVVAPAVTVDTISQGDSLFVSGGPGGVLKYEPGETLSSALADALQIGPGGTAQPSSANGTGETKLDGAAALARSRVDLEKVGVQRDGKLLGTYDAAAFSANGETGPALEPGDTIVLAYKPIVVRVLGDVAQPGFAYLSPTQSISEAIVQAGGLLPTAVSNQVELERNGHSELLALGDPKFTQAAQTGDVLTIPQAPRVNVAGMVTTPGLVTLRTDFTLLSAMYTAGGPTKWANLKDVQVIRNGEHTTYDVVALTHGDLKQNPMLKDGDTVLVPEGHKIDFSNVFGVLGTIVNRI